MKTTKDKSTNVRINGLILEMIKKSGMSVQKIVDEYVTKNFTIIIKGVKR